LSSIVTQNKLLDHFASQLVVKDTPMLSQPLTIDLQPNTVCRVWIAIILAEKAKVSITYNDLDYALLQKDDIQKDTVFQKLLMYSEGEQLNFECDKDVIVNRFVLGYTLGSI